MILPKIVPKLFLITLITTLLLSTAAPLTAQPTINHMPTTYTLNIETPTYDITTIETTEGIFNSITISETGFTTTLGDPKLPVLRYYLEIPQQATPQITLNNLQWTTTTTTHPIIPVQPSQIKDTSEPPAFILNPLTYQSTTPLQTTTATITTIGTIRGTIVALLEIYPIQYIPATGELRLLQTGDITISFNGANLAATHAIKTRYTTPTYEKFFQNLFTNYGMFNPPNPTDYDQEGYIIIVYDTFYEEIQPLANWKQTQGYDVTVTKTSQIPGGPTKENIYDYIEEAYFTWSIPPTYVLLVGDSGQIPTYTGTSSNTAADLYYVTVEGTDYFPDIYIGRFPGSQESHITAMVDKTVFYEEGLFESNDWIKMAAFLASVDNYQISEGTHNYVINNFLLPNGYICDKLYQVTYSATTQDVRDSINDGRSLVIYSGHGSTTSWADGPPFSQSDVNNLVNDEMYPFVGSHACVTGQFTVGECFGETWVRAAGKAAVVFWGSSANTYWDEDDILEKGMFHAWWNSDLTWTGGMTDRALYYVYQNYSGGGRSRYYFECYNIFGDPSLIIWSDDPNPNLPPDTPNPPNGPDSGVCNQESSFSASTTDPEGYDVFYKFDWGDNTTSGWIGPYPTGGIGSESHTWTEVGQFEVRVKAMDINGTESSWSEPAMIEIVEGPILDVGLISGGVLSIKSLIRNFGATDAIDVNWSITLEGGTILMGKETTGTIENLGPGNVTEIKTGMILGFGKTRVTVYAEIPEGSDFREQGATMLLFFILINPGGG
ncbi:MAG: hypothetical protein KKG04_08190 [Candidatus Thermoplasmatota archaeon]|nr:hypothetical protein [Candidatus Thermoplasmatota archaeon]